MMKQILFGIVLVFTLLLLAACGGGGGGGDNSTTAPTSATVKISLSGTLSGKSISGAHFTVTLPANVTPAMVGGAVAPTVVTPSGTFDGSTVAPSVTYTPATPTSPGSLQILMTSSIPAGVTTVGEIATISLQLANGAAPAAADFPLSSVSVIDTFPGNPIVGMAATVSGVTLQ